MNFDQWVKHETGSTWEEMGGMGMPSSQRHRLYNDYEEYCFENKIPFSLSSPKVGVTAAKLQEVAAAVVANMGQVEEEDDDEEGMEKLIFEDLQQDVVKVVKSINQLEMEFEMQLPDSETENVVMFFDQSSIPHFEKIVEMLKGLCSHQETETHDIAGTDERITICADCGKDL